MRKGVSPGYDPIKNTIICRLCNTEKSVSEFPKHRSRLGYDFRCKECKAKKDKTVRIIRRTAPPQEDHCQACGQHISKCRTPLMCLDHDPEKNIFRGWVCHSCNISMGQLGDNFQSIFRTLMYMANYYYPKNKQIKKAMISIKSELEKHGIEIAPPKEKEITLEDFLE